MENRNAHTQIVNLLQRNSENESMDARNVDVRFYLRKRYFVAASVFISWMFLHLMRVNLSISIVDMTSQKRVIVGNQTLVRMPEYQWSTKEKGIILSAFSWGYMFAPLGALVANKFGGAMSYGLGITATGFLTILTPFLIEWNLKVYLIARILEGVFEGFSTAVSVEVLRLWSTPAERSRIVAGVNSGGVLGLMLGYPVCGTIAHYMNWRAVFYVTGGISLMWSIVWFCLVRNCPAEDKLMSSQERRFLIHVNQHHSREKVTYPWKKILKSKPLWAYLNDRFVCTWSLSFLKYCLPLYVKDIHDVNIKDIGLISGIPHFCGIVGTISGSVLADYLRNSGSLSVSNVHKLYISFAQVTAITLLITVALWKNFLVSIVCFSLFRLLAVFSIISYHVLPVDIGGPYSALIHGLGYTCIGVGSSLNPIVMGFLITDHSMAQWSKYFLLLSTLNLWGGIVFYKYGSGKVEPWAVSTHHNTMAEAEQQGEKQITSHSKL